ncbi:hypothetical protein GCM10009844_31320 [Nocardioides koreensis]|uniref:TadE-like domain-containing protein n=1 Tax=Nocardioides koreensis TaxID=433651 RepID=A0ABN2ZYV7_9ACTN
MRNTHVLRRRRDEQGAAAVEFGLIALVLFTLLFGIIQFSLWFWAWQAGGHAARESSRVAAVNPCDSPDEAKWPGYASPIEDTGEHTLDGTPTSSTPTVDVVGPAPAKVGDTITVRVQFTSLDIGFFPWFDGAIDKSATSRVEYLPAGGCK